MTYNPLTKEERKEIKAMNKASLDLATIWDWLTKEQRKDTLEYAIDQVDDCRLVERAINGDMLILTIWEGDILDWKGGHLLAIDGWLKYRSDLAAEILARDAWQACINGVPGFVEAVREILYEMISEGEVISPNGEVY